MINAEISNPVFRNAVEAIDSGDINTLEKILADHPMIVNERLGFPGEGYFQHPYLLWFVADNPIRHEKLPANITEIAKLLIASIRRKSPGTLDHQLNYTLGLVITGRVPRECGVQVALIELLLAEGAKLPHDAISAITHGNRATAAYLISKGVPLTLPVAVCLDENEKIDSLIRDADEEEKLVAVAAAAFYGRDEMVAYLVKNNAPVNGYPAPGYGFHHHATPLHQAVCSGSLACVKELVKAGADPQAKDKIYDSTPLGWAEYAQQDQANPVLLESYGAIAGYLRENSIQ